MRKVCIYSMHCSSFSTILRYRTESRRLEHLWLKKWYHIMILFCPLLTVCFRPPPLSSRPLRTLPGLPFPLRSNRSVARVARIRFLPTFTGYQPAFGGRKVQSDIVPSFAMPSPSPSPAMEGAGAAVAAGRPSASPVPPPSQPAAGASGSQASGGDLGSPGRFRSRDRRVAPGPYGPASDPPSASPGRSLASA